MRLSSLAAALVILTGCGAQPVASSAASAIVDSLYRVRQPFQGNGAPSASDLTAIRSWLSDDLVRLLQRADSVRTAEAVAHPDEKPPFADGDLFTSLFEGPGSYALKAEEVTGSADNGFAVPVHFTLSDSANTTQWVDTAIVISQNGKLVLSDVRYGGSWDFANHGTLVANLKGALEGTTP